MESVGFIQKLNAEHTKKCVFMKFVYIRSFLTHRYVYFITKYISVIWYTKFILDNLYIKFIAHNTKIVAGLIHRHYHKSIMEVLDKLNNLWSV